MASATILRMVVLQSTRMYDLAPGDRYQGKGEELIVYVCLCVRACMFACTYVCVCARVS